MFSGWYHLLSIPPSEGVTVPLQNFKMVLRKMAANSKFEKINTILQTIASIATTFGVIFIVWQVMIARHAYEAQGWQAISNQMKDINKTFVEHPDLYPYYLSKQTDKFR